MRCSNEKRSQPAPPPAPESEKFERWTAQRKAAIVLDVLKGKISVPEAARKYGFTQGEFREWTEGYHRAGVRRIEGQSQGYQAIPFNASHPRMLSVWRLLGPEVLYWVPRQVRSLWKAKEIYITESGCGASDVC